MQKYLRKCRTLNSNRFSLYKCSIENTTQYFLSYSGGCTLICNTVEELIERDLHTWITEEDFHKNFGIHMNTKKLLAVADSMHEIRKELPEYLI